jgi:hypothetical protein
VFYNPSVTSSPGSLTWADFVHAMTSAGFAAEKMYGTMWHFTHPHNETRIEFRQPLTKGKLPSSTAGRFGRRLCRSFGYGSDSFILKRLNRPGDWIDQVIGRAGYPMAQVVRDISK